ncbi:hypothetical protein EMIT0194MI4_20309 [Pseudomonas sp. IT-194MI4]
MTSYKTLMFGPYDNASLDYFTQHN